MSNKVRKCKKCGTQLPIQGKVFCPQCGTAYKKPFFSRWWVIALAIIVLIIIIGSIGSKPSNDLTVANNKPQNSSSAASSSQSKPSVSSVDPSPVAKTPIIVTVDELVKALDENALKASTTYKNQYVELKGKLATIDSSGKYISLGILADDFSLNTVLCNIKKEHLDTVMNLKSGQEVTVIGTITDVGEVLGYTLNVESFK